MGIDLGTTFSAAAVYRMDDGTAELIPLGVRAAAIPSVAFLADDGSMLIGEPAARRSITDPSRVVREFKRRIGDDTPIRTAAGPVLAQEVAARFVAAVLDQVVEREGAEPDAVMLACPADWGGHKHEVLAAALAVVGLPDVGFIAEPEAAALGYAYPDRIPPDSVVGIYDLGGGTFDAAVVRALDDGRFEQLGSSIGLDHLGGMDFDEAVLRHVVESSGLAAGLLDESTESADDARLAAVAVLRRECTEAKEALSTDTDVTIPVLVAEGHDTVRMTRGEFESRIGPAIDATVASMGEAVAAAGLSSDRLSAVVLVGGSSRIPLVAQRLGAALGVPVALDTDPKAIVSIGAALAAAPEEARTAGLPVVAGAAGALVGGSAAAAETGPMVPVRPPVDASPIGPRRRTIFTPGAIAAVLASVIAAAAAAMAFGLTDGGSDGGGGGVGPGTANAETVPPAAPAAPAVPVGAVAPPVADDEPDPQVQQAVEKRSTPLPTRTSTAPTRQRTTAAFVAPANPAGPTVVTTTTTTAPGTTTSAPCVIRTETGPKPCGSTGGGTTTSTPPDPGGTPSG